MTKHEAGAREFSLHEEGLWYGAEEMPPTHPEVKFHVIEYSAFEKMKQERDELRREREEFGDWERNLPRGKGLI